MCRSAVFRGSTSSVLPASADADRTPAMHSGRRPHPRTSDHNMTLPARSADADRTPAVRSGRRPHPRTSDHNMTLSAVSADEDRTPALHSGRRPHPRTSDHNMTLSAASADADRTAAVRSGRRSHAHHHLATSQYAHYSPSPGARFSKYLTTILRLSYDNAKVTTYDLRRTSNLQNILRRAQGFSQL